MTITLLAQNKDKTLILVHGAWSSGHCWYKVTPLLESKGYKVLTIDLPGYGQDTTSPKKIQLDDYVAKVTATAAAVHGTVVLVGHSLGGAIISQASEVLGPEKVEKLIFLDAFLLKNGESIFMQVEKINASYTDPEKLKQKHIARDILTFSQDGESATVKPDRMVEVFCHDCPAEDRPYLTNKTLWQPVAPLATPITVSDERYGVIPKYYIHCTLSRDLDRDSILGNVRCNKIFTLPSSHSPFYSMPEKLVDIITEIY